MAFLDKLGSLINDQFGIGENTSHSINSPNGSVNYDNLGDFAKKIDQTAERTYIEDGFIRDLRPRSRSILYQQPDIFVVIKKKMFSSLVDNHRQDLMEEKERLLISASKRLFQNKCRLIANYERLTKIEQLSVESNRFNTHLGPYLLNLVDSATSLFDMSGKTKAAIDTLRKIISYSEPGSYTNWTTNDWDSVFADSVGEGPGTFELTNISNISTTVSTEWGEGSASITIEDPYNIMTITEKDIDQAIADVMSPMTTGSFFKFTDIELNNVIDQLKTDLAIDRKKREASQISFKVSPGTLLSSRVRAIMDNGREIKFEYKNIIQNALDGFKNVNNLFEAATGTVEIDPQFISGNDTTIISKNDQLTRSECNKLTQIISNIYTILSQRMTGKHQLGEMTKEINYARNRMRLFFNGKYIIQPMDVVAIYMTTRTGEDQRLPGGFQRQQNEASVSYNGLQKADAILRNINSQIQDLTSGNKTMSHEDIERLSTVGPHVPKWLWRQVKTDVTRQPTGPCIFYGLVGNRGSGVSGSWSDGKWTISVSCEGPTGYFDKSMINFQPAVDVFNSVIYDPLTPFDVSFDAATGVPQTDISAGDFPPLLPENKALLLSGMMTFQSGADKGLPVTEERYTKTNNEFAFGEFRKVLNDPQGMVYRWKQGIQTLTALSRPYPQTTTDEERSVLLTNQPFAGQDIMNVISLLVTGEPYNYATFLKSAIENGNSIGKRDGVANIPAAQTYIDGLITNIQKQNKIWGNFVPYKMLQLNPNIDNFIASQTLDLATTNAKIKQKLSERAQLEDEMILQQGGFNTPAGVFAINEDGQSVPKDPNSSYNPLGSASALNNRIENLSREIAALQSDFMKTVNSPLANNEDIGLTLVGSDAESDLLPNNAKSNTTQQQKDHLELRQRLFKNTARQFWKVRANEDNNLFIVDDQYDKNFDIQAFSRQLKGKMELFKTQYQNSSGQIKDAAKLIGLEIFANTQGHIQIRPPAYNKIPSTVFYKMFQERDEKGFKIFPDFLESLFFNQIKSILRQVEIIEDEIRLRAVALGATTDDEIVQLVSGGYGWFSSSGGFNFLTTWPNGDGRIATLAPLLVQTTPDWYEENTSQALDSLNSLNQIVSKQLSVNRLFTPVQQVDALRSFDTTSSPDKQISLLETVRDRLRIKTGKEPNDIDQLFGNDKFRRLVNNNVASRVDRVNLINQIENYVIERQTLLRSVSNAIRGLQEGININNPKNKSSIKAINPSLNRKTEIPQFLEHMIEDENFDDIGYQSGRRFVLTSDRIISLTISENPPPFTMVTVKGLFGQGFIDAPGRFQTSSDGGNAITTAYAVDYDMWYQYGFRAAQAMEVPYFSDPETQCTPAAFAALLTARENILQGNVQIAGYNEFYQPGDVIFIEDRNLLFYVKSVKHNFSYGKLSTTLDLTYGHSPGEYIPTMLDVVGKILYNAKGYTGMFRNERMQPLGASKSLGAITVLQNLSSINDSSSPLQSPIQTLLRGKYGERNKNILTNALFSITGSLNQVKFKRQKTKIKIVYYKTTNSLINRSRSVAFAVKDWLINPEKDSSAGLMPDISTMSGQKIVQINPDDIIIEELDLSNPDKRTSKIIYPSGNNISVSSQQSPSISAIDVTRHLVNDISPQQMKTILANSVVDLFVVYEKIKNSDQTVSLTDGISQAGQSNNAAIDAAKQAQANAAAANRRGQIE